MASLHKNCLHLFGNSISKRNGSRIQSKTLHHGTFVGKATEVTSAASFMVSIRIESYRNELNRSIPYSGILFKNRKMQNKE